MKKVSCKDIDPSIDCDYTATGSTESEVIEDMMEHAKSAHPDKVKGMSDADIRKMIASKVKNA